MQPVNLKKTSVKLVLSETPTATVLEHVNNALQSYSKAVSPLALLNKARKIGASTNLISKLKVFEKDLRKNIEQGVIVEEDPLNNHYQVELLHILYGFTISRSSILFERHTARGQITEQIKFEDSTTYAALLDIRVLILGTLFTECTRAARWNSQWLEKGTYMAAYPSTCRPLNDTIKALVDSLYNQNRLSVNPQAIIYYIYLAAKNILEPEACTTYTSTSESLEKLRTDLTELAPADPNQTQSAPSSSWW